MYTITESNMLLRTCVELPVGLKLGIEEFREGWGLVRKSTEQQLQRKSRRHGWSLVKGAAGLQGNGVGDTSQLAIASALKLALRNANKRYDAAEVEHIELTQYPWFFLARIQVYPYLIQQGTGLPIYDDDISFSVIPRHRKALVRPHDRDLGRSMSQLKKLLVLPQGVEIEA
jgi:hypothetical protein